jgi:hypothetical protein
MIAPQLPTPGTDADRFIVELQTFYPYAVWSPNERLGITAHSRANDLRQLGWSIESVRKVDHAARKGKRFGYLLHTPREQWPTRPPCATRIDDATGQVAFA